MLLFLCLAGVISGITTVMFGFGGGFFTVPLLAYTLTLTASPGSEQAATAMNVAVATSALVMLASSLLATLRREGRQIAALRGLWPLALMIAIGAIPGALAARGADSDFIRYGFVVYLGITLLDCLLRPGFMQSTSSTLRPLSSLSAGGLVIGAVAAFLGVGGSVMTVPLLRRRGASMVQAAAIANALTLPMALSATLTYMLPPLFHGSTAANNIDLPAAMALIIGAFVGMKIAGRGFSRLPDRIHVRLYPCLLGLVLVAILWLPVRG